MIILILGENVVVADTGRPKIKPKTTIAAMEPKVDETSVCENSGVVSSTLAFGSTVVGSIPDNVIIHIIWHQPSESWVTGVVPTVHDSIRACCSPLS